MKGLLYKEFYLGRKHYLSLLALTVVFSILGILVCLSMICGNLQELAAQDPGQKVFFGKMFIYYPFSLLLLSLTGCDQSIYGDYESGWMSYSYTFPGKTKTLIGARYMTGVIILAVSILYGLVNAWIISALTEVSVNADILKNMVVILIVACILYAFLVPLALKYKTAGAVSVRVGVVGAILYILIFAKLMSVEKNKSVEEVEGYYELLGDKYEMIRDVVVPFSPLLLTTILVISFLISVKIYQRREK